MELAGIPWPIIEMLGYRCHMG